MSVRSRRFGRRIAVLAAASVAVGASVAADSPPPPQWEDLPGLDLVLDAGEHSLRIAGADRYETSLALALVRRGEGDVPFSSPDRTSGGAPTLAEAGGWWGTGVCPRAIIVVAGDVAADALAAAPLSDPTGLSSEPRLRRTASADPLFDPVGAVVRVDTDHAPIVVTESGRSGATALSDAARIAAKDLRDGGCRRARSAIVVGGTAAVPAGVDDELLSLGYAEVFRVAGANRYDTAATIAASLGTASVPSDSDCLDERADDGDARRRFLANAAVEYRPDATSCEVLRRTVVIADGIVGADALAAGWWTSYYQTPLLLHDGSDELPEPTRRQLATMGVDNVIVLGGRGRIPDAAAIQISSAAGANVIRVAGDNRAATSVAMARHLGGWFPDDTPGAYANSIVCVAASTGNAATGRGWPDALGVAPLCGGLDGSIDGTGAPRRAIAPVAGSEPKLVGGSGIERGRDAVPVLLTIAGVDAAAPEVAGLLREVFPTTTDWCTSDVPADSCEEPGFAVIAGGSGVISPDTAAELDGLVAGRDPSPDFVPSISGAFWTELDLSPVYEWVTGFVGAVCVDRGATVDGRWLAAYDDELRRRVVASQELMIVGRYLADADDEARSPGTLAPSCAPIQTTDPSDELRATAVAPTGALSDSILVSIDQDRLVELTDGPIVWLGGVGSGTPLDADPADGSTTSRTYGDVIGAPIESSGTAATMVSGGLTLDIIRGAATSDPDRFTAIWSIVTDEGVLNGAASGEAIFDGTTWRLRGRTDLTPGSWDADAGTGGFVADITPDTVDPLDPSLDAVSWQVDAIAQ